MKMKETSKSSSPKYTREDWIAYARKVLVENGVDDVKVDRLATQMRVTRGGFYWHFKDRQDLLDALFSDWEVRNYFEIAQVKARWARSEPDLSELVVLWLGEDPSFPAFDMAIRVWARKAPLVADAVRRVDEAWISLLGELFFKSGFGEIESLVRARVTYFHQIGYYALGIAEEQADRIRLAPYYYEVLTGHSPSADLVEKLNALQVPEAKGVRRNPRGTAARADGAPARKASKRSKAGGAVGKLGGGSDTDPAPAD